MDGSFPTFLSVDFDGRELRIALMERGATLKLRRAARAAFPEGVSPADGEAFGAFLAETIKTHKLGTHPVLLAVPRSQCVIKLLRLPPNTAADEAPAMVQFQASGDLPFGAEESVLDFAVQTRDEEGLWILASAMHARTVEQYRRGLISAGLKPLRLALRATATARAVSACGLLPPEQTAAVVFITHDETEVSVFCGERAIFSRAAGVAVGSEKGLAEDVDAIVSEVIRSLQGFQAMHHENTVSAIYIAGATGLESEVAEMLSQLHGVSCQAVNPYEHIKLREADVDGPSLLAAIGLSIGAPADRWPIDFFDPKKPITRRTTKEVRRNVLVMAAALIVLVLGGLSWYWLDSLEAEVDTLVTAKTNQLKTQDEVKKLKKRVDAIDKWAEENGDYLLHLAELSALMSSAEECYLKGIVTRPQTMVFTVYSRDPKVVETLATTLNQAGYSPELKDDKDFRDPFGYARQTDVTVTFPSKLPIPLKELDAKTPPRPDDDDLEKSLNPQRRNPGGGRRGGNR